MSGGIYCIRNITNNKVYVGQTYNFELREQYHFSRLRSKKHHNVYLQNAFCVCGQSQFAFEILERADQDKIDERERHWILTLHSCDRNLGYNLESGGFSGKKLSELAKKRRSQSMIGRIVSTETRTRIAESLRGKKRPACVLLKIAEANRLRSQSVEWREKIRQSRIGTTITEETRRKMSQSHTGKTHTKAMKSAMSNARKGCKIDDAWAERLRKHSEARRGTKVIWVDGRKMFIKPESQLEAK